MLWAAEEYTVFTGLVRHVGSVMDVFPFGKGKRFRIDIGPLAADAEIGQSIAINGVCLTATALNANEAAFDAVAETASRSNLGLLRPGSKVNLEPALKAGDALDGHIMLGHVDAMGEVLDIQSDSADNRKLTIRLPESIRHLVADKGSVAISGISLTVASVRDDAFTVAVIPHTWNFTTLSLLAIGDSVNLEADVMARYAARILQFQTPLPKSDISLEFLQQNGFA